VIRVVNKGHPTAVYCGRPSVLGNPFYMRTEAERDIVCDKYEAWFKSNIDKLKPELDMLLEKYKQDGVLYLACFCAPKRCHCDTIKKYLEDKLAETTLLDLIRQKTNDTIITANPPMSDPMYTTTFVNNHGNGWDVRFTIWTNTHVLAPKEYDGKISILMLPREPILEE
jgi:hypothetical protein